MATRKQTKVNGHHVRKPAPRKRAQASTVIELPAEFIFPIARLKVGQSFRVDMFTGEFVVRDHNDWPIRGTREGLKLGHVIRRPSLIVR